VRGAISALASRPAGSIPGDAYYPLRSRLRFAPPARAAPPRGWACYPLPVVRSLTDVLAAQRKCDEDDRDLRSRSDARRERKRREAAFAELGEALVNLSPRRLEQFALPEGLRDAVLEARAITSPAARMRALRLVRRELRACDEAVTTVLTERIRPPKSRVRS